MTSTFRTIPGEEPETIEPRIKLIPFTEIKLSTQRRYLVKDLIPCDSITVIWGPPKNGKSFWTFDLLMHIALGRKYRGRPVQPGPVVYCAFEGERGIEARVAAYRKHFLQQHDGPIPFYLQMLPLNLVDDHQELIAAIRIQLSGQKPEAIALDTLNKSFKGSESSDLDMTAYVAAANAIRDAFHCAVCIVHHCGHDKSRMRGHSALIGAQDAELSVSRDSADNIIVEVMEMRDGACGSKIASRLERVVVGKDVDGEEITSCVVVPVELSAEQPKSQYKPLSSGAEIVRRALLEALDECGERAPASNHIPADTRVVSEEIWRDYAYRLGISTSDEPRARQQAFTRGKEALVSRRIAGIWNGLAWNASRDAHR